MSLVKNQTERTNPRDIQSVENKKRHLPSCAYLMFTHNSDLIKEDGFTRRSTGHEFTATDAKTAEEINAYNDWFNENGHTFGYLGDFAIWYYLNNPDILFDDGQTIAEQILIEFYRYASLVNNEAEKLEPPEWLLNEYVQSATSQEGLVETRRVSIINTLHDVVLNQPWKLSTYRKDIVSWIVRNLRKDAFGKPVEVTPDMIDEFTMSATMEEKLRAIAELNLVPYVKWHKKKEVVCIGAEFVKELKRRDIDRVSLKQIESYCPQLKYDEHVRLGDGYSNKQKMLTITVENFAKMLTFTDSAGGSNHQTQLLELVDSRQN
jgi:hypothetical protein